MTMLSRDALLGTWKLEKVWVSDGDTVVDPAFFGENPYGVISYMPDDRMSVVITHGGRGPIPGGRAGSDADLLEAARTFVAYAGPFSIRGEEVVHHIETNSFPNDVGSDYVRHARLEGDTLQLSTPFHGKTMRLFWRRHAPLGA
jgi:hypothetical protein